MRDYTLEIYLDLINAFRTNGYRIVPVAEYLVNPGTHDLILRHDVDRWPVQALNIANIDFQLGIKSTFYFRIKPSVFKPHIISEIYDMGHEIGYHYEDLVTNKGDLTVAFLSFQNNLDKMRSLCPIRSICAHGSPLSKWDSKSIWERNDYKALGILGDTAFDVDYNRIFYITDNGRGWNKRSVSIRDKVVTKYDIYIRNTHHFIKMIETDMLPPVIMLNVHPDTFFDFGVRWISNLILVKTKNIIKYIIIKRNIIK